MTINFPNQSRSYDATRRAVRFWGYDRSMEASFFMTADALKRINPICSSMRPSFCVRSISIGSASMRSPPRFMRADAEVPTISSPLMFDHRCVVTPQAAVSALQRHANKQ